MISIFIIICFWKSIIKWKLYLDGSISERKKVYWITSNPIQLGLLSLGRAQDKVHKMNFNRHYSRHFFTKSYVWPLVRIVSMRRFYQVVIHRILWRNRHYRTKNTHNIWSPASWEIIKCYNLVIYRIKFSSFFIFKNCKKCFISI